MKKTILFLSLVFASVIVSAQTTSDFSYNMVRMTDATSNGNAPQYGFITGTDKSNENFYFVMIYPQNIDPVPAVNIKYITEGFEKNKMRSVRASLIPYSGIVLIGSYRIAVYQAAGRTSIRRKYVQDPAIGNRANFRIFINRNTEENEFEPDFFDSHPVEMNTKRFDPENNDPVSFRLLQKIPDIIASGYPVVDADGYFNGLIASSKGNEIFDVITTYIIKQKLSAMSDNGYDCKYFNLIYKGHEATDCDEPYKNDSVRIARKRNLEKRIVAKKHDVNYPFAVSVKAGGSGHYMNIGGTVTPGIGYYGGLNLHLFPDTGFFAFSITPQYGQYRYNPRYSDYNATGGSQGYDVTRAERKQVELQFMAEFRFNRRLVGQNYLGIGYSRIFTQQQSYRVTMPDGTNTTYILPNGKKGLNALSLEIGWDLSKMRYAISTTYLSNSVFPVDYSQTVNNTLLTPFQGINQRTFLLNFEVAFRLWGHWRNGIKG
ncbi:hypothetical protein LX99_02997 [Mucilaginibacter oryzae]|uniref:Outer membrane protein with beta-barrel domain n=1 Tax=Mucilaginibacter oryzae TaxID=468058 RepID=A0A316H9N5_9SPHI|nr:hypothetical protein [Mucilaginibacter oryzae]PWK77187.1 hypothetical protein LX99_02997 [Mucilaginibacter oryzae]